MNNYKNYFLLFITLTVCIFVTEIILSKLKLKFPNHDLLYKSYSKKELDKSQKFRHQNHGGNCVKRRFVKKMQWHPRFGYNDINLNIECVNNLFRSNTINIIFFGGSAMANYETPNYLTSIEYYMFGNSEKYRSINLAEGGSRLSNELAQFIEYVPKLKRKPDYAIFFDGYNEFQGVRYNGNPEDDFYWTASVSRRIHHPIFFIIDKLIEKSFIAKLIFYNIFQYNSARMVSNEVKKEDIIKAAEDYILRKKVTKILCKEFEIECIFAIQPAFILTKNIESNSDKQIFDWHEKNFPNDRKIYEIGYNHIFSNDKEAFNLTNIFDNHSELYFDYVHSNKKGSKLIAIELLNILKNKMN